MSLCIPKIIFQTSKNKNTFLEKQYEKKYSEYRYIHFDDQQAERYLLDQSKKDTKYSDIYKKFKEFHAGPHKADLLRYYWLYKNGGIYFDTDVEIVEDLGSIIKSYCFVGVTTNRNLAFNGFIACSPQHPIVHKALINSYLTNIYKLTNNYLYFCKNLMLYINEHKDQNTILYKEEFVAGNRTHILDKNKNIQMIHHYHNKNAPAQKTYYDLLCSLSNDNVDQLFDFDI